MASHIRTRRSRADLIRCRDVVSLQDAADLLGFERTKKQTQDQPSVSNESIPTLDSAEVLERMAMTSPDLPKNNRAVSFCRATHFQQLSEQPVEEEDVPQAVPEGDLVRRGSAPKKQPLTPWSRLWPLLYQALGSAQLSHKVDIARLVATTSRAQVIRRVPYQYHHHWAGTAQIVLDFSPRCYTFHQDYDQLCRQLMRLRGEQGLEVISLEQGSLQRCQYQTQQRLQAYRLPTAVTPILILSDLGQYDRSGQAQRQWLALGKKMRQRGLSAVVLTPTPPRLWQPKLCEYFYQVCWDRNVRIPSHIQACRYPVAQSEASANIEQLLTLLSAAIRVEPELLRAVRLWDKKLDVGTEAEIWQHPHVIDCGSGFKLVADQGKSYRQLLRAKSPAVITQLAQLLQLYHASLPAGVKAEELSNLQQLGYQANPSLSAEARYYLHQQQQRLIAQPEGFVSDWVNRAVQRLSSGSIQQREWAKLWVLANQNRLENAPAQVSLPEGLSPAYIQQLLASGRPMQEYQVVQYQGQISLQLMGSEQDMPSNGFNYARIVHGKLRAISPCVQIHTSAKRQPYLVSLGERLTLPAFQETLQLTTDMDQLTLQGLNKPDWAKRIGTDQYGIFAEFEIAGVVQRMRWINPGRFMMGSPKDEEGRYSDEDYHQVTLTQGYWLADTTVTQALWQAVMKDNPSHFKGALLPVENVSWKDAVKFIQQINQLIPPLNLQLPSEAQWEYACRAGSKGAFNFEGELALEKVNYRGTWEFEGLDAWGEDAKRKTVEVKSYPANAWGLYEMHGNVWEWCQDAWQENLGADAAIDPGTTGRDDSSRVVRGGSWSDFGGGVRSACRRPLEPGYRYFNLGFRLSRGQSELRSGSGAPVASGGLPEAEPGRLQDDTGAQRDGRKRKKAKVKK